MKAVIYARVSSKEQEETGFSLDAQIKLLQDYAKKGLEVVKIFRITESASKSQIRKTLGEMLAFADKNGIGVILCEKIDRLTRNLKDAAIVDDWVHADDVREVHFVKEHFILNKNTKAHDNFIWDMKVAVARFYTNNLSEEVRKGQKEKIEQGWLPSRAPLGYKTIGEKGHKIHVLNEEKAHYIRSSFERYAAGGLSLAALRDKLYEEGLRTHGGAKLSKSRLAEILGDPFYYGAMRWNDVITENGKHEPMVSRELWDKVQVVLQGKTAPHHKRHLFKFTKRIKCDECGGTISGEIQKGHVYYSCKHSRICSQRGSTREETIEKQLMGVFSFFENMTAAEAEEVYARIRRNHQAEVEYKETTLRGLNARYMALQRQLDILYDDRLAEKISQERWQEKQESINAEREQIRREMEKLQHQETKYFELYINILDLARRAREIYEKRTPEQRRMLLAYIFSNLTLKDKNINPVLKSPVERLSKRIQEKLDARKNFESKKGLRNKANLTTASKNDFLLRG